MTAPPQRLTVTGVHVVYFGSAGDVGSSVS